jgi:serine/threonine protein kinase
MESMAGAGRSGRFASLSLGDNATLFGQDEEEPFKKNFEPANMPPQPVLTSQRWQRISGLVDMALELERPLRAAWLEAITQHDPELRRQVYSILRRFGAEGFDNELYPDSGAAPRFAPDPNRVGPYRLLRQLGQGGMGVVHLAERVDHEFERQVAIKIIAAGHDAPIVHQRFLSERQILARFDHPNIARLFEGGSTPDGRPYFVMEFVDGPPIDRFCRDRQLGLDQRLELFLAVCSATAYAHQRLVVHRDLKPSNILVGPDGQPKLLDFGIAKLLDPAAMPFPLEQTRIESRPMTLGYAAPEQMVGDAVSTATDVFALGALLYVLLTGRLPFDLRADQSLEQQLATLRTTPVRPSTRLRQTALDEPTNAAGWQGHDLAPLARQVAGDLDNIARKALRYESGERYGAVADLVEDLERYRNGEPVTASRDTPVYLAGKFIRRYRFTVGATAALVLILLAFSIVTSRQATLLEHERDRAAEEAARATHTRDFLADILRTADSVSLEDDRVPLKTLLDLGFDRVRKGEIQDAKVRADLFITLAQSYTALRDLTSAARSYEAALESSSEGDAAIRGRLHQQIGQAYLMLGDIVASRRHFERALALLGGDPAKRLELRFGLALAASHLDAPSLFAAAEQFFAELQANGALAEHVDELLQIIQLWGNALNENGFGAEAQTIQLRAASAARANGRAANRYLARLPSMQQRAGQPDAALPGMRILYEGDGTDREDAGVLHSVHLLAQLEAEHGSLDRAERAHARLAKGTARLLALNAFDDRARYLQVNAHLTGALILERKGQLAEAAEERAKACAMAVEVERSSATLTAKALHARALLHAGRVDAARPLVAELVGAGFRQAMFVQLAQDKGALPSPMPELPPLRPLPPWVEAWLPAPSEPPSWEAPDEIRTTLP